MTDRATQLPEIAVACPRCGAGPGELCTSHGGTRPRRHDVHRDRHSAWTRQQPVTTTWHTSIHINGEPYPTRHHAHFEAASDAHHFDLPVDALQRLRAIHEAAHAVVAIAGGGHLHHAQIETTGWGSDGKGGVNYVCGLDTGEVLAAYCGAGERADDRWLREQGLWTPAQAVRVEVGAASDRRCLLGFVPNLGFGDRQIDYRVVHDLADRTIDQQWPAITAVAEALVRRQYMSGDAIARIANLPNGTCNVTDRGRENRS